MYCAEDMKRLQDQMYQMHEKYGTLIHPFVVMASQQLNKVIMKYYQQSKS